MISWIVISILIGVNILSAFEYSPTWDFPLHLYAGLVRLREVIPPDSYRFIPYGIFADIIPVLFSRIFPPDWFPGSYLLYAVVVGCMGAVFFYLFLRRTFGEKTAILSVITLFLAPRFIGHLHTNIKDTVTASFFMISMYFYYEYLQNNKLGKFVVALIFFTFAVNTKLSVMQLVPIMLVWAYYRFQQTDRGMVVGGKSLSYYLLLTLAVICVPLFFWFLLWPESLSRFYSTMVGLNTSVSAVAAGVPFYSLNQLLSTTPVPILFFSVFGLFSLFHQIKKKNDHVAFFFFIWFFYTLLKYPLLRQPIIDDVRYFLDIFFPLSLCFVLGIQAFAKKRAVLLFVPLFIYLGIINIIYHPYQISYYNFLATSRDPDFWAASFSRVFKDINNTAAKDATVSAKLAPELAYYLLRPDLKRYFNSQPPEKSDIAVVLNRPSGFEAFGVKYFVESHKPQKIYANRLGEPLSFIYYLKLLD